MAQRSLTQTSLRVTALALLALLITACTSDPLGDTYVGFAQCLTQKGVTEYGAYWCPHCARQKALFGKQAFREINYVECDPRGAGGNPELCLEKKVQSYPTWIFSDESRLVGETKLETLAEKSGCTLPQPPGTGTARETTDPEKPEVK